MSSMCSLPTLPREIQASIFAHLDQGLESTVEFAFAKEYSLSPICCTNRALHAAYVSWYYGQTTILLDSERLGIEGSSGKTTQWTKPNATPLSFFLANISESTALALRKLSIRAYTSELLWLFAPEALVRILNLPIALFPQWTKMRQTIRRMRINILELQVLAAGDPDYKCSNPFKSRLWPDARWVLKAVWETMGSDGCQITFRPYNLPAFLYPASSTIPPQITADICYDSCGTKDWSWEALSSSNHSFIRHCSLSEVQGPASLSFRNTKHAWSIPAIKGYRISVNDPVEKEEVTHADAEWQVVRKRVKEPAETLEGLDGTVLGELFESGDI
ncbi:hypothetical protein MBLNU459_g5966t1 [Dothideomycetes sp. NU459]